MRVLVGRGGELVSTSGPVCDYPDWVDCCGLVLLDCGRMIQVATVADRPDVTFEDLEAATRHLVKIAGWTAVAPDLAAELAHHMAANAAEIAAQYPPGTQLRADYDRESDEWTFRVIRTVSA
jgi:hypothetical protein